MKERTINIGVDNYHSRIRPAIERLRGKWVISRHSYYGPECYLLGEPTTAIAHNGEGMLSFVGLTDDSIIKAISKLEKICGKLGRSVQNG